MIKHGKSKMHKDMHQNIFTMLVKKNDKERHHIPKALRNNEDFPSIGDSLFHED